MVSHLKQLIDRSRFFLKLLVSMTFTMLILGAFGPIWIDLLAVKVASTSEIGKKLLQETWIVTFTVIGCGITFIFCTLFYIFNKIEKKNDQLKNLLDRFSQIVQEQNELKIQFSELFKKGQKELVDAKNSVCHQIGHLIDQISSWEDERFQLYQSLIEIEGVSQSFSMLIEKIQNILDEYLQGKELKAQELKIQLLNENLFKIQLVIFDAAVESGKGNYDSLPMQTKAIEHLIQENGQIIEDLQQSVEIDQGDFFIYKGQINSAFQEVIAVQKSLNPLYSKAFLTLEGLRERSQKTLDELENQREMSHLTPFFLHQEKIHKVIDQLFKRTGQLENELDGIVKSSQLEEGLPSFTKSEIESLQLDGYQDIIEENRRSLSSLTPQQIALTFH